jgi:ribosome-binding factor A
MSRKNRRATGPSQRQLRAGELVRHALSDLIQRGDVHDRAVEGAGVTITEVVMSPDLRVAFIYCSSLGGEQDEAMMTALRGAAKRLRGLLGREIDLKFTPELRFEKDQRFERAERLDALLRSPEVRRDLVHDDSTHRAASDED